jgi:general nucleoside transport system permease protein
MSTLDATFSNDRLRRLTEPRSIAILGIALGMLSLWSALPPWTSETAGVPIFIALLGVAAALWAFNRDERHLATWAVAVSVVGCAAALWLQTRDASVLDDIFNAGLLAATLRFATPLMFAAIGGIFNERSGVINIGLEGMILAGAFFGIWATVWSGSWVIGLVFAVIAGGMLALVLAVFAIHLRADQIVIGTAINFLALGLTGYLFRDIYGTEGTPSDISRIPDVHLGFVKDIPFIGDIFGQLNLMIWLMFVLLVVSWVVLFKTPVGLRLRSVGEHPKAADTVGISVFKVRYAAVVLSGALAALGGAYLSIGFTGTFNENMSAGRGFIALAAVIVGKWNPFGAFGACLLFGFASALSIPLQREADISANLVSTLPYLLTLIALVGVIGRSVGPAAVGRPYTKQ